MLDRFVKAIRPRVSGTRALADVVAISSHHRIQASPGLDAAADWLAAAIEREGVEVTIERTVADGRHRALGHLMPQGWACERAIGTLHGDGESRVISDLAVSDLAVVIRSAAARGRFPVVRVDRGTEPGDYAGVDVRGRVVLTRGDVHRVHELAVLERGAAGLLSWGRRLLPPVREEETDLHALAYTSFWWGSDEPRGWGLVIPPEEARRLIAGLADGARLELEVEIEARAFDTTIPVVSALHGPAGAEEIVLLSHLCHPRPSANDNASGAAANLEAARAIAAVDREGILGPAHRRIRQVWSPEFTGTYAWLAGRERMVPPPPLIAALNLDMVGEDQAQCGSTFLLEHPPCFAASFAETLVGRVREACSEWVDGFSGPGYVTLTRMAEVPYSGGSDHTVLIDPGIGVPCPMLVQWPDRFYHSSLDTPDRCDPHSLALAARTAATYAAFLARAGAAEAEWLARSVAHRSRARLLDTLDHADPPRRAAAERLRAGQALESIRRIDPLTAAVAVERAALEDFWAREIAPRLGVAPVVAPPAGGGAVPLRRVRAPLHYQRWLLPGWSALAAAERERWRTDEAGEDALTAVFDLAWSACNGTRDLPAIAELVRLECGRDAAEAIARFFSWTSALGLSEWRSGGGS